MMNQKREAEVWERVMAASAQSPCPPQSQGGGKPGAPVWLAATLAGVGLMLLIICLPPCFWIAALGAAMVAAGVIMVVGKK